MDHLAEQKESFELCNSREIRRKGLGAAATACCHVPPLLTRLDLRGFRLVCGHVTACHELPKVSSIDCKFRLVEYVATAAAFPVMQ